MAYFSEFRDPVNSKIILDNIHKITTKNWMIMEICGGQTHAIKRYGIDQLLPENIELVHGPGCPVCVTPLEQIDKALEIASLPNVIFTSYGDMLRVPGSSKDLFLVRSTGADIRVVYSPLDALQLAQDNPTKEVVFFAIGFETTAPANAMAVYQAKKLGIKNFSILVSHVRVPPAIKAILSSESNRVQGFLAAGHVCAVMGYWEYLPIAKDYNIPIAVTGFEPLDLLKGIHSCINLLETGQYEVSNEYSRIVSEKGNVHAQKTLGEVFQVCDRKWRGIGMIPESGWMLKSDYTDFDAENRFDVSSITVPEPEICISGEILQGLKKPPECPAFRKLCSPENPLGATMVSSEGACSAYYRYTQE